MREVREVLRLHLGAGLAVRTLARQLGLARSTVQDMLGRFGKSGLEWPLADDLSDAALEDRLYGAVGTRRGQRTLPEPDWATVASALKRKHVTLQILWEEYIAQHPQGYRYSRFCDLFRRWEGRLPLVMRQSHAGGEKLFVDYAGDTVPVVIDRLTGEVRDAHIFVAVMGASSLSFACATWTEQLPDWIEAHNAAFAFFGGVPQLLVPDNTKVAVIRACQFDPMANRTYRDMANHYGTAMLPARPYKPRDKAKVEAAVRILERWLLGRLRNRVFYSLAEVNAAIAECLADLNDQRVLRQFGKTRRALFTEIDAPNLKSLPAQAWMHAEWRRCRVGLDYHVEIERHFYSVPCSHARREVEARLTVRTVEIFLGGERIAGLVHALLDIGTQDALLGHPVAGASWEGFAIETLIAAAGPRTTPLYYRTADGAEIDLVIERAGEPAFAIEIKRSSAPKPEAGFHRAVGDIGAKRRLVVAPVESRYPLKGGTEVMALADAARELAR